MPIFLGIDGGGTKTLAVILDGDGHEAGRGRGGPCNVATCSEDVLRASIRDAVSAARSAAGLPVGSPFAAVGAGVAGYTSPAGRATFRALLAELAPAPLHVVEPDYVGAFWGAARGEPGVVIIAGTGAVAFGRNAAGRTWRIDGRGYLLGDRGSAFDIARSALRSLVRRNDRGGPPTPFDQRLMAHIGVASVDELIEWLYRDFRPARVAELTRAIGAWAAVGDETAAQWIGQAADALRSSVAGVMCRLDLPASAPVYCLGGLWQAGPVLQDRFRTGSPRLLRPPVALNVRQPACDAACGAAFLAAAVSRGDAAPVHPQEEEDPTMFVMAAACALPLAVAAPPIEVIGDWQLRVNHGAFRIGRRTVRVTSDTVLTVTPAERIVVRDERHETVPVYDAHAAGWAKGAPFGAVVTCETTAPDLLDPSTVRLKSGPGDADAYVRGTDYDFDDQWGTFGRLSGKIADGMPVWCDYETGTLRIDAIVVDKTGNVSVLTGKSHNATPHAPDPSRGQTVIARIWLAGRINALADRMIYPVVDPTYRVPVTKTPEAARLLPKTWAKLRAGQSVHVLAWGDSVTAGGQASSVETQYQSRFVKLLRERFPSSDIRLTTAAWGGRNSDSFLNDPPDGEHNFEKVVMRKHPDLIVMEFVNDAYLDPAGVEAKYSALLARFRAAGIEWAILTPHLVWHTWLGLPDDRVEADPRPYVAGVRAFAAKHGVALADASARWCHLVKEGIPYQSLLANSLNHPDDRGHEMFALALMDLFGGVKGR